MSRLPFSTSRMNDTDIDPKRGPDLRLDHPVRAIRECLDDVVYNAVDIIQEHARDNELRTFYFNLMSDRGYRNREFEDLISVIADLIDIGVTQGKFRDERDAVIAVTEDVIGAHVGYMCDVYPELFDYVDRRGQSNIDRAISVYTRYLDAVDLYRRNGNEIPSGRGRDRRDDRDRGGRVNYGSERDRDRGRRDRWNRDGIQSSRRGSPRSTRENRFGNSDQSDRFDDDTVQTTTNTSADDRYNDNSRYEDRDRRDRRPVQRMPVPAGRELHTDAHGDIDDALARDGKNTTPTNEGVAMEDATLNKNPIMRAFENVDAWVPSIKYPHPPVFSAEVDLYFEMDINNGLVVPVLQSKDGDVDYYAHDSIAFGASPKDFRRFQDDNQVAERIADIHSALVNPETSITEKEGEEKVTLRRYVDLSTGEGDFSYTLKDMFARLSYDRICLDHEQRAKADHVKVDLASSFGNIVETVVCTSDEAGFLEELRQQSSLTKLCEKLRQISKLVRPEVFLQLDRHIAKEVVRMMRQYLSIPSVRITSFTQDWLELFAHLTEEYGEGYRDAINTNQSRFIEQMFNFNEQAEVFAFRRLTSGEQTSVDARPFVMSHSVRIVYINEVSYNLNIDMLPDVASQLMTENTPFFHDLVQHVMNKGARDATRFFIQTSDLRTFEASKSWMNDSAVLLRLVG